MANSLLPKLKYTIDAIELRFDGLDELDSIQFELFEYPVIFTVRRKDQGGKFEGDEAKRWLCIQKLCALNPNFIDLEYDAPLEWFEFIQKHYPNIQVICSYHDLDGKGLTLDEFLESVESKPHALLKYAKYCENALQGLELLNSARCLSLQKLSVIAMGPHASFVRVLGPLMGNYFDYACLDETKATASGQISVADFHDIYHYPNLNSNTKIYALLGHPVEHSLGHHLHNQYFFEHEKSCVYVKIDIEETHLKRFLKLAHKLPFEGFSVTMPLKQVVSKLITNSTDKPINTLKRDKDGWQGFNTDGLGALQAINLSKPAKILILGFGGAARGIGCALEEAGHEISYAFREGQAGDWENDEKIDGIISTLPPVAWENTHPIFKKVLSLLDSKLWVMDINYNQASFFEDVAAQKGCHIISGYQMFLGQAIYQWQHWEQN